MTSLNLQRERIKMKFGGRCAYCGAILGDKWHKDHVEPVYRGCANDGGLGKPDRHIEANFYPACPACNLFKSVFSLEDFRQELSLQVERARKYSVNFRTAERFGLIEVQQNPIVFWFEQFAQNNEEAQG